MIKRIVSIIFSVAMYLEICLLTAYAEETEVYDLYQEAVQATIGSGGWTENLTMTADMALSNGNAKTKTKVTINSFMDISNYFEDDLSNLQMSGSANMSVMGQSFAWDVQYKNGIAHYEYTEPNQTSADIEMEPDYFNFKTLNEDMFENAKILGNQITFTIPGNKMEEGGLAAVNLMAGVDNLDYDDVDVEVTINKITGAIDTMVMTFHALLTYQGYDAEVGYTINYDFSTEINAELKAYTAFPNSKIGTQQEVKIQFSLYINDVLASIDEYSLGISNPNIVEAIETSNSNGSRIITFRGRAPGDTELIFTENATGISLTLPITVEEKCNYFRCSAFPIPYESIGSIYVADFLCTANADGSHNVTFNAYNTSYAYGVVEVYDKDNSLLRCIPLAPRTDGSGMEKVVNGFKYVWEDVVDIFDGDTSFYTKESNAKETPVVLENIPENAEIIITSDGNESMYTALYTGVDLFVRTVFAASSIDLKVDAQMATVEDLVNALIDSLIKSMSSDETNNAITQGILKESADNISTALAFASTTDSVSEIYETVFYMFESLEIDAGDIIINTLKGMGYSVADSLVTAFIPTYKIVNLVDQILEIGWPLVDYQFNVDRGKIEIHVSKHGVQNYLVNSGVSITQKNNFSSNSILDAYMVIRSDELQNIPDSATWNMKNYSVYSITLREEGKEVQPNEKIAVKIPIPVGVDENKCKVYRIENGGKRTLLESTIDNGYVFFKTSHLSYYIIGESGNFNIFWFVVGVAIIIFFTIVCFLFRHKKVGRLRKLTREYNTIQTDVGKDFVKN